MAITINAKTSGAGGLETTADNTGNINIQSGGSTVMSVTSSGVAVTGSFSQNGAVYSTQPTFRNRIINGDMRIDQRNAGASVTPTVSGTYTLDRFQAYFSQASKFSVQQNAGAVTSPAGFTNYLGVTSLSAYSVLTAESFVITQRIEGYNIADLAWGTADAKTVTLSFQVYSSLTGTFGGALRNSAGNRSYPFNYTISSANTWEQKSITVPGDTTGTWLTTNLTGMLVYFTLGAGTNYQGTAGAWAAANYITTPEATSVLGTSGATLYITGVQLEVGSTATDFENLPYDVELARCQRYYYKHVSGANPYITTAAMYNSSTVVGAVPFPVTMRSAPALDAASGTNYYRVTGNNTGTFFNSLIITGTSSSINTCGIGTTSASGVQGQGVIMVAWNANTYVAFDSEL
jgi:hypothetical protein